jgi:thioredoxin-dependent peroxiredoxin
MCKSTEPIIEEGAMTILTPGDTAPAFEAPDQNDNTVSLAAYRGRKLFLFFYPKANTSG